MNREDYPLHNSQRGYFSKELYFAMKDNPNIVLLTGDLGYKVFDLHRRDFPDRVYNVGASEQAMIGIATGMSYRGKLPIVYSITNFILYRPYEWLRNYTNYEQNKIILIGSGRDDDYKHDGWTHQSPDAKAVLNTLPNIRQYWPETTDEVVINFNEAIKLDGPSFISLRR